MTMPNSIDHAFLESITVLLTTVLIYFNGLYFIIQNRQLKPIWHLRNELTNYYGMN